MRNTFDRTSGGEVPTRLKLIVALLAVCGIWSAMSVAVWLSRGGTLMLYDLVGLALIPAAIGLSNGRRYGRWLMLAWFITVVVMAVWVLRLGIGQPDAVTLHVFWTTIEGAAAAKYLLPTVVSTVALWILVTWQLFSHPVDDFIRRCEADRAVAVPPATPGV